jgi:zinc transporter 5/7
MYGLFLHVLADTLGSIGVVISTLLIRYKGWLITDPACSIVLSFLIIASVVPLLRNSAEILLQRVPRHNENGVKKAMAKISSMPGVRDIGRMHVWSLTNTAIVGSVHIQISAGVEKKRLQDQILKLMHKAGINDVALQIEEV